MKLKQTTLISYFRLCISVLVMGVASISLSNEQESLNTLPVFEDFDPSFHLPSTRGNLLKPSDYKGELVLVNFGFASCPDVCPTVLSSISKALKATGANKDDAKVLFITIDPERDDIESLTKYLDLWGDNFIGLSGEASKLRDVSLQYQAMYEKREIDADIKYVFSHTDYVYLLGRGGHLRSVIKGSAPIEAFVAPIKQLLNESL